MAIGPATGDVITIAVMGATGTGKSTFVNMLSGSNFPVGAGLLSCTPVVQMSNEFALAGRRVRLIDTPGFDDTLKTDREILQMIASFLADQYRQNVKLSGVIYMHRISDFKMSGISRRNFGMFRSLCGEKTLRSVVIVTNMWAEVTETLGTAREKELATDNQLFKPVIDNGARMMRHHNTLESAQAIIQTLIANHPVVLQIQSEVVDEHRSLEQTRAGAQLESEAMAEAKRKQEADLQKQREAAAAALRAQQEQQAREMQRARQEREAAEARARAAQEQLLAKQAEARRQEEQRLQAVQREAQAQAAARRQEEERVRALQRELEAQAAARRQEEARQREIEAQAAARRQEEERVRRSEVERILREANRLERNVRRTLRRIF